MLYKTIKKEKVARMMSKKLTKNVIKKSKHTSPVTFEELQ
jgi:hypothetical protein